MCYCLYFGTQLGTCTTPKAASSRLIQTQAWLAAASRSAIEANYLEQPQRRTKSEPWRQCDTEKTWSWVSTSKHRRKSGDFGSFKLNRRLLVRHVRGATERFSHPPGDSWFILERWHLRLSVRNLVGSRYLTMSRPSQLSSLGASVTHGLWGRSN